MPSALHWCFGPFRLDPATTCLWQDNQLVPLPPKPFAVLTYLVGRAGEVVTKDELLEAVWPETVVSEGVLKTCIGQIRQVLGETGRTPQYIATIHRRGYRFIAPVTIVEPSASGSAAMARGLPSAGRHTPAPPAFVAAGLMVARDTELAQLQQCWAQALQGRRQIVCLTGEAGIGKTTLADVFVAQLIAAEALWYGRGQCIEPYGAGEAYLPLLEALGQLGRGLEGVRVVEILRQQAPNWLFQMPALWSAADYEALQRHSRGTTRERMLWELAEAVETLTAEHPLVLVLEDLHWSDSATLDWLAFVAHRRTAARLLVVGTYRPADAVVRGHPVHTVLHELQRHGQGTELPLGSLSEAGVATYLAQRFGEAALPAGLARVLQHRTNGNSFFLVAVVEELVRQGILVPQATGWTLRGDLEAVAVGVPESVRQLIDQQLAQVRPEVQAIMEAASVAGIEFAAAAVAAAVDQPVEDVEACCDALARRGQFVRALGLAEWPDGTAATRYGFLHSLYPEVLYARVPVSRRTRWHRQIGTRLEAGYGARARELAAELAEHFVRGRDTERAVWYLRQAADNAFQRHANREAISHLNQALALLQTLPDTLERTGQELTLQATLGRVLAATQGFASTEAEQAYTRALALCQQIGETTQRLPTLRGLCQFYTNYGALQTARELGEQLLRLSECEAVPLPCLEAHEALGQTLFQMGDYAAARLHLEQGIARIDPMAQRAQVFHHDAVPGVRLLAVAANTLWCLGYPAQAVRRGDEALALAQAHPYSLAIAQHWAAFLHYRRCEVPAVAALAAGLLTLATAQGFPLWAGYGTCWRGWALAMQGHDTVGLTQLRQGMAVILAQGMTLTRPVCLILLAEALAAFEESGRGDMLAEAYRLQGELLLRQAAPDAAQAEACFQQAQALARRQQARAWELRAAISLGRLWRQQGKRQEAWALLAPIYHWFTEGFDTADLQEAKGLLAALES